MNQDIASLLGLVHRASRRAIGSVALAFAVAACNQNTVPATLRSLQGSGDVSFVCVGSDGTGRDLTRCPDFEDQGNRMLALVTQSIAGEVALIQLSGKGSSGVIDVDPSTPGYNFLRIGANPVDIVSTPDGVATFVGVAELNRPGIYALPTTCLGPPKTADAGTDSGVETARDITSWPACALPSAPGEMAVVIDPPQADGSVRERCAGGVEDPTKKPPAALRGECSADLTSSADLTVRGRRKLAVALPDLGQIAIIDAQALLDRQPGSFDACPIEGLLPLSVNLPPEGVDQPPGDLAGTGGSATCLDFHHASPPGPFTARPSGFALVDHDLYVADQGAPVIHDIDLSDPCHPVEKPAPLLPVSLESPERVVTTTRLAGSPVTRDGHRYLYAIDEMDQPAASVMVFDITPGASSRTPLIRPGAARMPLEPPDRIGFTPAAQDVAFALHDLPISDATGNAVVGTSCDPDPSAPIDSPGALYRPSRSLATGAGPGKLRGIFGFVMLTNGQIGVIDLEDFDAPCRRPTATNSSPFEDFRGCKNDPADIASYTLGGVPTVTNEVSCHVVEPHRVRARDYAITSDSVGVRAPSLRSFPTLTSSAGGLVTDQSDAGRKQPKLLPADFPNPDPSKPPLAVQVYIGSTLFSSDPAAPDHVDTDPGKAERSAVALPLNSPRAYASQEDVAVTYEGPLFGPRNSGLLRVGNGDDQLEDTSGAFCTSGIEDVDLAKQRAQQQFPELSGTALDTFAREHADYVQIVDGFLPDDDPYWTKGAGATCGGTGRKACVDRFGQSDAPTLPDTRDLSIVQAWENRLSVVPKRLDKGETASTRMALLACCFPSAVRYTVRASAEWVVRGSASGFRHRIKAGADSRCVPDCNPRKRYYEGRAFEISSTAACGGECPVGPRVSSGSNPDVVCNTYQAGSAEPSGDLAACIFDGLTARFAIYRGQNKSERDMTFGWQTVGGFRALTLDLVSQSTAVLPQSLQFLPELNQLVVVDGESLGLTLMSLDSLGVVRPSPFY